MKKTKVLRYLFFLGTILFLVLSSCTKEETVDPCDALATSLEGTYEVTLTSYPRQPSQEGEKKDILVFTDLTNCQGGSGSDRILFNNLFEYFGCTGHFLVNESEFEIEYTDNLYWAGAYLKGTGSISNGNFYFEGNVFTSAGEFPIVLVGEKTSQNRRTDAC